MIRLPPISTLFPYTTLFLSRDLGRVREDADPEDAAAMLLGACFQRAFFKSFFGEGAASVQDGDFVEGIVQTLMRSEEHTSELQSRQYLVCRLLLEKKYKATR